MKKRKKVIAWCPKSPTGIIWENWIERNRRKVLGKLHYSFAGWREDGYTVVKVEIKEVRSER